MDARHFDTLTRALSERGPRRGLLGLLATLPLLGGLFALFDADDAEAKGRRKRRKKKHKHGRPRPHGEHKKQQKHHKKCKAHAHAKTCAGKCGSVKNNCKKTVDCGSCDCDPPCETCFTCQGEPGACVPERAGTACGSASCAAGELTPRGRCDGSGSCQPGTPASCAPYIRCDGNACATSCADDDDCVNGSFCNGANHCVGDARDGEPCNHGGQCSSGHCVNDVCCNAPCDGACEACNLSGRVGTCTTEPDGSGCGGGDVCCGGACRECCAAEDCPRPACQLCSGGQCLPNAAADGRGCGGGDEVCCNGACVACCDSDDCLAATPICVGNTCEACTGSPACPSGCCNLATGTCGFCLSGQICGGGNPGTPGVCGCTPTSCPGVTICQGGQCVPCGFPGQTCCAGNVCSFPGTACQGGLCVSVSPCGSPGLPCCAGNVCTVGNCQGGLCVIDFHCGFAGLPCCAGVGCFGPLACHDGVCSGA